MNMLGMTDDSYLTKYHKQWAEEVMKKEANMRDPKWMESIAVGSRQFIETTKTKLGIRARGRKVAEQNGTFSLRENQDPYSAVFGPEKVVLSPENAYFWNKYA